MSFFSEMMDQGGWFMWPILTCAVFSAAIVVERFFYVFLRASIHAAPFWAQVQRLVLDGDVDGAVRLCNSEPSAVLPKVVKAGLVRVGQPDHEVRDGMEEAALEIYPSVQRRLGYLPMIANVSTLIGLLGTIDGLITAFKAVEQAGAEARSAALASGIAVAMYATFGGLFVAIPTLVGNAIIAARANQVLDEVDHYVMKVVNLLRAVSPAAPPPGGGSPVLPFRS